jgi:putative zinc finger protein
MDRESMPHIPEDELHAYLDQALGRLRCVEIESHLAECTRCRDARDGIAALRDRTTALLARLAPRRTVVPSYGEIRRQAQLRMLQHRRVVAGLAWAASIVIALGIGWTASAVYRGPAASGPVATAPVESPVVAPPIEAAPAPALTPAAVDARLAPSAESTGAARVRTAKSAPAPEPRLAAVPVASRATAAAAAGQGWRTVAWDAAPAPPARPDSTVTEPLTPAPIRGAVVTRQLASGEVMRSVSGVPSDVSTLLSGRPQPPAESRLAPPTMPPAYANGVLALRQRGAVAAPSAIPSDSLRAMMRRLNLMLQVR